VYKWMDQAMLQSSVSPNAAGMAYHPQGGMPPQGGGMDYAPNGADDPLQLQQRAQEAAQQWLQMDESARRKEMAKAKATNPTLHAAAKQAMEEMRSQAASQGRAQVADMIGQQ